MSKLSTLFIKNIKEVGKYHDGAGLYFIVRKDSSRSWEFRKHLNGKKRYFSLGSGQINGLSLAQAREKAIEFRDYITEGLDPLEEIKRIEKEKEALITFEEATKIFFEEFKETWSNVKHQKQWITMVKKHAFPVIGNTQINDIRAPEIIDVLSPIWLEIPVTAKRIKQRIGAVLDWAHAKGYRDTEAPLRSVEKGLPKQPKRNKHFPAMPYEDVPAFMVTVNKTQTMGRYALKFTILCASRSGEVRGATWSEIDLDKKLWTIPSERMKAKVEHIVPLTEASLEILTEVAKIRRGRADDIIFTSYFGTNKQLSDMTLTKALRDMEIKGATVHGFRSSFRDWAAESDKNYEESVVELALAHTPSNKVLAAYRRTNYLEKRKPLMQDWADYILPEFKVTEAV